MRLDKMLSNLKYGSRKYVKKIINAGLVTVNEKVILKDDYDVDQNDKITVDGEEVYYNPSLVLMMNKPQDYICSNKDEAYPSVLKLIEEKYQRLDLNVAGRLDVDTEGLLILTNDGILNHKIISPNSKVNKVYFVKTRDSITEEMLRKLHNDILLKDKKDEYYIARAIAINKVSNTELELTIDEGKFHQVKNMIQACGNEVIYLKRLQIGSLKLENLELGKYRELTSSEVEKLLENE